MTIISSQWISICDHGININKLFLNNIIRFYLPEWRLLNKLPRNLTCSNFVLILYVIRKPLKQPITTLLGMVVVFCSWSAFFQLSAWIDEKKLWLDLTVSYSFDIQYSYSLFWFSNYNLLTKNIGDIFWKIAYVLFAILDWYSPGLQCMSLWSI